MELNLLYGMVVKGTRARGWLWAAPLIRALEQGRSCVLITSLNPASGDFQLVLRHVPGAIVLQTAIEDGRLALLLPTGDNSVNLYRRGARGLVLELQALQPEAGTLFVVDQADDFFTAHDPKATQEQVACYREWCTAHRHTMLLVFLRVTLTQPLLGGNHASLSYFDGLADATLDAQGLRLQAEFWDGQNFPEEVDLCSLAERPRPARGTAEPLATVGGTEAHPHRSSVWYVGSVEHAEYDRIEDLDWRVIESLGSLFDDQVDRGHAVVALDKSTDLDSLLLQVQSLRARPGRGLRLVIREHGYRLREFTQRLMLVAAGADAIVLSDQSLDTVVSMLTQAVNDGAEEGDARRTVTAPLASPDLQTLFGLQTACRGHLPVPRFCEQVLQVLSLGESWAIPSAMIEFPVGANCTVSGDCLTSMSFRPGDVCTQTQDAVIFFLHGCRPRDAIRVLERLLGSETIGALGNQLKMSFGGSCIRSRLQELASEEVQPLLAVARPADASPTISLAQAAAWTALSVGLPLIWHAKTFSSTAETASIAERQVTAWVSTASVVRDHPAPGISR